MVLEQIITSLLDTDLYKFSMGQAICHNYMGYTTTWTFRCRNKDVHFTSAMVQEIKEQIKAYCQLEFKEEELEFLKSITWFQEFYINYLRGWRPRYEDFEISDDAACGLSIEAHGTWLQTSMYEIPVLAIVNEVYFRMKYDYKELFASFKERLHTKIDGLISGRYKIGKFSEFGLRRRLSKEAQEYAIRMLMENKDNFVDSVFIGTSNVYFAYQLGLLPVGTMAHEWIMCIGQGNAKLNPAFSNWFSMHAWVEEYGTLNGIVLTDAITTDCFLRDFQLTFAKLFSGVRHDSGDPYEWGDKMIEHYKKLGLDPTAKTLLFSDSLNFEKASKIYAYFKDRADTAFGIGTFITNDTDVPALNIVMKTTECNGMDVAKISDTEGKGMCKSEEHVAYLKGCIARRKAIGK